MKTLIVFTKVPERGTVKTRLAKKIPAYLVEELYIAFLEDTLDKVREYFPWVAYWPPDKLQALWSLIGDRKYVQQRGKEYGDKLFNAFSDFYRMGIKKTIVINCDVPTLRKEHIDEAFELMDRADLVLGPCKDGGFYLIGGGGVSQELFSGMDWSGEGVYERVCENAKGLGLRVESMQMLQDVDHPQDLDAVWNSGELDKAGRTYKAIERIKHHRK